MMQTLFIRPASCAILALGILSIARLTAQTLPQTPAPGIYKIASAQSGLVLDVPNGSQTPGVSLNQAQFSGIDQEWQLLPTGDGFFTIASLASGMALDVRGASTNAHAAIDQLWHSSSSQEWAITATGGTYKIASRLSGQVLESLGPVSGALLDQAPDAGVSSQRWTLTAVKLPSVRDYGAKGDGQVVSDVSVQSGSATVSSASALFTSSDVGKAAICVQCSYAHGDMVNLVTTIAAVSADRKSVTLADTPVNSLTNATLYWGSPDLNAFNNMYADFCNGNISGNIMYIPPAQKSFYMLADQWGDATWVLDTCGGWQMFGAGISSWLVADAGDQEILTITRSSANSTINGLQISNVHTGGVNNPDFYWFAAHLDDASQFRLLNSLVTGGRCALEMDDGGDHIEVGASQFIGNTTSGINANGTESQLIQYVNLHDNSFTGTIWMDAGGTGHDINLEDTGNVQVVNNRFVDNSTPVRGSSAIQVSTEEYIGTLSNVLISNNNAILLGNSSGTGNVCIEASSEPGNSTRNYVVSGNYCDSYAVGFSWSGISAANQVTGVLIAKNWFRDVGGMPNVAGNGGIYFGGNAMASEGVTIASNEVSGNSSEYLAGGPGISINRINGVIVKNNYISYMPEQGIALNGAQASEIQDNIVRGNGHQQANRFDGISCTTYTAACAGNTIAGNTAYDDQGIRTQRYGLYLGSGSSANVAAGNVFRNPPDLSGNMLNLGVNILQ